MKGDTYSTQEQAFNRAVAVKQQQVYQALANLALDLKPQVKSENFTVTPEWRDDLFRRFQAADVPVSRAQFDSLAPYMNRLIGARVARTVFGDSAEKRRDLDINVQLRKAMDLLQHGPTRRSYSLKRSKWLRPRERKTSGRVAAAAGGGPHMSE